jgi:hypothetical protein
MVGIPDTCLKTLAAAWRAIATIDKHGAVWMNVPTFLAAVSLKTIGK